YLARDFARMNKKLQLQLREIKQLFEKTVVQESERKRILENQKTELERKVIERTAEVTEQKGEIERKNRDILDNLNYAKRIQSAILPETSLIHNSLPDSFILYRPKDIVSGDFYTFSHKDNRILLSVADCTGHGVTGAFMSMIGSSQLNQIINERGITQPAKILNHLNTGIAEALKQNATDVNDGMDIALCSFSPDTRSLEFAGANRPMWLIRGGEWVEIKPDKLAIGGFRVQREAVFTNHEIQLQPGDAIYLFTDGFADQFGGPDGKKMLSKRFRELLISMQSESMQEQERKLNHYFDKWKNSLEQVDDVLVIGIRI
ncbi:MAG TPA: SpoIIE family protein phosphatase, partial [Bacteroidia bacterium]|nr:SpoIIE family protein phosphatase [Bacteroidia bacterium]